MNMNTFQKRKELVQKFFHEKGMTMKLPDIGIYKEAQNQIKNLV